MKKRCNYKYIGVCVVIFSYIGSFFYKQIVIANYKTNATMMFDLYLLIHFMFTCMLCQVMLNDFFKDDYLFLKILGEKEEKIVILFLQKNAIKIMLLSNFYGVVVFPVISSEVKESFFGLLFLFLKLCVVEIGYGICIFAACLCIYILRHLKKLDRIVRVLL